MIDFQQDFGFNGYSTFTGKADWKFTWKNHLYLVGSDFNQTRQVVLPRAITFQGQTFEAGATVKANLQAPEIAPGYQYYIIQRKRGHLGVGVQIDLFDASARISAAAQVTGDRSTQRQHGPEEASKGARSIRPRVKKEAQQKDDC